MAGAGRRSVERVGGNAVPCLRGKPGAGRLDGDGSPEARPVLGYILKGYPRISETFISNEILLLEQLGFSLSLFSMRQPRESFTHRSVKEIKARAAYLPEALIPHLPRLLYHNALLARSSPGNLPLLLKNKLISAQVCLVRTHSWVTLSWAAALGRRSPI